MCLPGKPAAARRAGAPRILEFGSRSDCERALCERISARLAEAARSSQATLVLSGGSTPAGVYEKLSHAELPWEGVTLTLSDERWVDEDAPDSNARLVRESLLRNRARHARFVGLKTGDPSPEDGVNACQDRLATCRWPAAVVLLGMGNDGHTASLFPDDPGLAEGLRADASMRCVAARPASMTQARMSLSLSCLLDSKLICILVFGEEKKTVLQSALDEGPVEHMPVRGVLKQGKVPVEVYWAP